jgi:hypothetical protein
MGAGPGEERGRQEKWQEKISKAGLTMAQASGRRNYNLSNMKKTSKMAYRLPAIATQDGIRVATYVKKGENAVRDSEKKKLIQDYFEARGRQKNLSRQVSKGLEMKSKAKIAREEWIRTHPARLHAENSLIKS